MNRSLEVFMGKRSRKSVVMTSIVTMLAGIAGIALPRFISMAVAHFAGWPMLVAGGIALSITEIPAINCGSGSNRRWQAPLAIKPVVKDYSQHSSRPVIISLFSQGIQ